VIKIAVKLERKSRPNYVVLVTIREDDDRYISVEDVMISADSPSDVARKFVNKWLSLFYNIRKPEDIHILVLRNQEWKKARDRGILVEQAVIERLYEDESRRNMELYRKKRIRRY
jgi:hypothetical protein